MISGGEELGWGGVGAVGSGWVRGALAEGGFAECEVALPLALEGLIYVTFES